MIIGEAAPYRHVERVEVCQACEHRKEKVEKLTRKFQATGKVFFFFFPWIVFSWYTASNFYPHYQAGWGDFIFGAFVLPTSMLFLHVFAMAQLIMALEE